MALGKFCHTSAIQHRFAMRTIDFARGHTGDVHRLCWSNRWQFSCSASCTKIWLQTSLACPWLSTNRTVIQLQLQLIGRGTKYKILIFFLQLYWILIIYADNAYYLYVANILEGFITACLVVSMPMFSIEISHDGWVGTPPLLSSTLFRMNKCVLFESPIQFTWRNKCCSWSIILFRNSWNISTRPSLQHHRSGKDSAGGAHFICHFIRLGSADTTTFTQIEQWKGMPIDQIVC